MNDEEKVNWTPQQSRIVEKWIMILLAVNDNENISGRLRFTKELFIIAKEVDTEFDDAAYFFPYSFGPYSSRVALKINQLKKSGIIKAKYTGHGWKYYLNEEYIAEANDYINEIPEDIKTKIQEIKDRYKSKSTVQIVKEIYAKYPRYTTRSSIKNNIIATKTIEISEDTAQVNDNNLVVSLPILMYTENEIEEAELTVQQWPENIDF